MTQDPLFQVFIPETSLWCTSYYEETDTISFHLKYIFLCYILFSKNRGASHAHKNDNSFKKILVQSTPRSKEETLTVSKDTRVE